MQVLAGTVVLTLNMNKKKLNPPFNLLCFKYCFCCSPFCEEVIEWPSENCTALQWGQGGSLKGVCVKFCILQSVHVRRDVF